MAINAFGHDLSATAGWDALALDTGWVIENEYRVNVDDESFYYDIDRGVNFEPLSDILDTAFRQTYVRRFPVEPLGAFNPYK